MATRLVDFIALWPLWRLHRRVLRALQQRTLAEVLIAFPALSSAPTTQPNAQARAQFFTRWLRRMARRLVGSRSACLDQAIALRAFLAGKGIDAQLRIGVKRNPFAAHAWIEVAQQPVLEKPQVQQEFICFDPLPEGTIAALTAARSAT